MFKKLVCQWVKGGIQKLVSWQKRVAVGGDYAEKRLYAHVNKGQRYTHFFLSLKYLPSIRFYLSGG